MSKRRDSKFFDKNIDAWLNQGYTHEKSDEYTEANECYDKGLGIDPNSTYALNRKGIVLEKLGKYEEAIICYNKVIALKPNYAAAWMNKATAEQFLKKYDKATESYKKALALNPKLKEIIDLKLKIMEN
jgi:tetratricopeptide (TPR) repeat protein